MRGPAVMVMRVTMTVSVVVIVVVAHYCFDCAIRQGFLPKTQTNETLMIERRKSA
jgi:hypothetical protein